MRGFTMRLKAAMIAGVLAIATGSALGASTVDANASVTAVGVETGVERSDEMAAAAAARQLGTRVEVTSLRTETDQVFANPDGTMTQEQNVMPVRVRRDGEWVPVDTTLARQADGTIAPRASVLRMAFSGGGTSPMMRLDKDGKQLALSWPTPLPAPILEGDTVTYPGVLPGVDLKVRADVQSLSHVLVVKTPEAARNPAIAKVRLGMTAKGLIVHADHNGNLSAVDGSGQVVFRAPPAKMWDSAGDNAAMAAPGPSARQAIMPVHIDDDSLTLLPDQAILTGPDTKWPVYLDPSWGAGTLKWIHVNKKFPAEKGWNYDRNDGGAKVGYDSYTGTTYRSFFQMNTSPVNGKHILAATFRIVNWHSWSCNARVVELWMTGAITVNTSWNAQPGWLRRIASLNVAKGYSASCPDGGIEFNALSAVQDAARGNWANLHLALKAFDESDTWAWKKFNPNATLVITYNSVPNAPSSVSSDQGVPCMTGANRPKIGTTTPTLRATIQDADNSVKARFEWWNTGGAVNGTYTTALAPSGTTFSAMIPVGRFANGSNISWRVRGEDGIDVGPYGPWCEYTVDTVAPDKIPGVTSTDYPEEEFGGGVGRVGTFFLTTGGVADVTGYQYALNGGALVTVPAAGADKSAIVQVTPDQFGINRLTVRSKDGANNLGPIREYLFKANRGTDPVAHFKMNEYTGSTAADEANTYPATLSGGASWQRGRSANSLRLDGATYGYASTGGPVIRTDQSFTAAAWVRLHNTAQWGAALSQQANRANGFSLQYAKSQNKWLFAMYSADADTATIPQIAAPQVPQVWVWTHLAAVYDSGAKQMRLYVNGELAGTTAFTSTWTATGGLQLGRARWAGVDMNHWTGDLDEVRVYDRVVFPDELANILNEPALAGGWHLEEGTGSTTRESSGTGNTATLMGGASWGSGRTGSGLALNGTGQYLAATRPAVRSDQSFTVSAWVRLDSLATNAAAIAQYGTNRSAFHLEYLAAQQQWSMGMTASDTSGAAVLRAAAPTGSAVAGDWTHLVGLYDADTNQIRLYIDGVLAATATHSTAWHGGAGLTIGGTRAGAFTAFWTGEIDEVSLHHGVLSDQQIYDLYLQEA